MMVRTRMMFLAFCVISTLLAAPAWAQYGGDTGTNHPELGSLEELLADLESGAISFDQVRALGLSVFSTPFNTLDGYGDGPFDPSELGDGDQLGFGHRPTLQGNGLSLRLNGLDAQSCNECHGIISHATRPPTLGIGGVGGIVNNAVIMPSLIDVADSLDDRVIFQPGHDPSLPLEFDGVADFNGRYANPPFLFGGGAVELLGKEMTAELQTLLAAARQAPAGTVISLDTHGVHFGTVTSLGSGEVDLAHEGIGLEKEEPLSPEELLVVRPFGRKGDAFTMRDFDRGAMQFHFGIQPVEVVGPDEDEDRDGVYNEVDVAEMSVLHIFDVTNPKPVEDARGPSERRGKRTFGRIGCANCHRPELRTHTKWLPLAHPEVPDDPDANVYLEVDLADLGFRRAPGGGLRVPLYSDLKRHYMGERLAETFERAEVPNGEFITARLWGIADTAPYLHDGRATTLHEAIEFHGGEAQQARDDYMALSDEHKDELINFLGTLRTPEDPNEELIDLVP